MDERNGTRRIAATMGRGQRSNYATAENLVKRQALFDFVDPSRTSGPNPLETLRWTGAENVLDVGCGNGIWTQQLAERLRLPRVIGIDLSKGMAVAAKRRVPTADFAVADAQSLPHPDGAFDVVMAFWMLYHVPDCTAALREIARVLAPSGALLAVTNSNYMHPLEKVTVRAIRASTGHKFVRALPPLGFSAENASAILHEVFAAVEETTAVTAFAIPEVEPILDAMKSTRDPIETYLGVALDWDDVERHARAIVSDTLKRDGVFRSELRASYFACRKAAL